MFTPKSQRSAPGRRSGRDGEEVKVALLEAARHHFLKREFKAVSVRELSATAGVNAAMVNYYFGSKQALYEAMIEDLLATLEAELSELSAEGLSVTEFSARYSELLAANPWWPNFIVREVLFSDGPMRGKVLGRFAASFAPRLLGSIEADIKRGRFRAELDPRLTLLTLMATTVFPFLARPLIEEVLNLKLDADFVERLSHHNAQLFRNGVLTHPDPDGGS